MIEFFGVMYCLVAIAAGLWMFRAELDSRRTSHVYRPRDFWVSICVGVVVTLLFPMFMAFVLMVLAVDRLFFITFPNGVEVVEDQD